MNRKKKAMWEKKNYSKWRKNRMMGREKRKKNL